MALSNGSINAAGFQSANGYQVDLSTSIPEEYIATRLQATQIADEYDPGQNVSTYKPIRNHNNMAIDDFYQQLIRQSNNLSVSTFRNDLLQHEARSRAEAKRQPQQPIIVNQILPGEEGRFLSSFLRQPYDLPTADLANTTLAEIELAAAAATRQGVSQSDQFSTIPNDTELYANNLQGENNATRYKGSDSFENKRHRLKKSSTGEKSSKRKGRKATADKSDIAVVAGSNGYDHERHDMNGVHSVLKDPESRKVLNKNNPVTYMDIEIDNHPVGTLVMELFSHVVPKTAENFRALCTGDHGFGYHMSYFHRIIPGFVCQGGDFEKSDGTGGYSVYGGEFDDENFNLKHDRPFLLSMANCGPNTNGSQFFITVIPCPHLDGKHVVFGQIIKGFDVIKQIEQCGTESGEITKEVKVVSCGQVE